MDLSGIWSFRLDNGKGFEEKWYEKPLKEAVTMAVPASYNDLKDDKAYRDHYGWVFYQKKVVVPEYMKQQRVMLRLDAVTHAAKVYFNGKEIANHKGGFLPFEVDISFNLKKGENLLTIAVDNRIDHSTLPVGSENQGGIMMIGGIGKSCDTVKKQNRPKF